MSIQFRKLFTIGLFAASLPLIANAQSVLSTISFPNATSGIATNPVTDMVYVVAPSDDGSNFDSVGVINGKTDTLTTSIQVPVGAYEPAVDYLRNLIYVAGCNPNETPSPCIVSIINGKTNKIIKNVAVTSTPGQGINGLAVNPLTGLVYVANGSDNVIDIINCEGQLVGSIGLAGQTPSQIALNPFTDVLYVPLGNNLTDVISGNKKEILATTTFGNQTVYAAVNFVSGHVFVNDFETGPSTTGVLNASGVLQTSVSVGDSPFGIDVDPVTNLAFVASTAFDSVTVINGKTNTVQATVINVPAFFVAVNFATEKVYASGSNGVTVISEK